MTLKGNKKLAIVLNFRPNFLYVIEYYFKIFGTLCCIVPNITLSLTSKLKNQMKLQAILGLVFLPIIITANIANGQSKIDSLYKEIAHMDSVLFNAFNTRDTDQFKTLFTEDLEFYHDNGGLTNYAHTINFLKTIAETNSQLKRELIKESMEVYPIPGYGAMQIGQHTFCHPENGKQDCGTFKFVHIWQKKNGKWKISRVISYGHQRQ